KVVAGVQEAEIALPERLARHVVAVKPFRAEERNHPFAVRGRGAVGVRCLGMALDRRDTLERIPLPQDLARLLVEADNLVGVHRLVFNRGDVAIEPDLEVVALLADRGGDKDPVTTDHRAGVSDSGNRRLPTDIRLLL